MYLVLMKKRIYIKGDKWIIWTYKQNKQEEDVENYIMRSSVIFSYHKPLLGY